MDGYWDPGFPWFARLGRMLKEKASGLGNVIVPEMLKALPTCFVHEVAHLCNKRFQG